jgi:Spy/CpxP family protein refolding chaperone
VPVSEIAVRCHPQFAGERKETLARLDHEFCTETAGAQEAPMSHRLLVLLLAASLALGQGSQSGVGPQLQKMAQQLELSESQKQKIMSILVREEPRVQAVKADTTLPQSEKAARMMEIKNETDDTIRPLLTPTQQVKLDQLRQQQRQQILQELTRE